MAITATAYSLRHVATDLHGLIGIFIQQYENGEQANAKATIDLIVVNAQLVQTAVTAATNATINTSTVVYVPWNATT